MLFGMASQKHLAFDQRRVVISCPNSGNGTGTSRVTAGKFPITLRLRFLVSREKSRKGCVGVLVVAKVSRTQIRKVTSG